MSCFTNNVDQMLRYIRGIDPSRYDEVLVQSAKIGSEDKPSLAQIKKALFLRSVCVDLFRETGKPVVFFHDDFFDAVLTNENTFVVSGWFRRVASECFCDSPNIEHLVFEEGVENIDYGACCDHPNLKSVHFPRSLKYIEGRSFRGCTALETIVLDNPDTGIFPEAFENTKWMSDFSGDFVVLNTQLLKYRGSDRVLYIPSGVRTIACRAFAENETIEKVVFPESLREISIAAFTGCSQLKEVVFRGDTLDYIELYAFDNCPALDSVKLPEKVKEMDCMAFDEGVQLCYKKGCGIDDCIEKNYPNCKRLD